MAKNTNLNKARAIRNDEFYTRLEDIENHLSHFKSEFQDKVIYCNCDDYNKSNFYKYFSSNFDKLNINKLICTAYNKDSRGFGIIQTKDKKKKFILDGDGSFDSDECKSILSKSDIIVTNPPFSLFKKYMQILFDSCKSYIILGNTTGTIYQNVFTYFKENKIHVSESRQYSFLCPDNSEKFIYIKWLTNLNILCPEKIAFTKSYNPKKYPKFVNFSAINVDRVKDIPKDYYGVIGVPITFLEYYNPEQFEIVGIIAYWSLLTEEIDRESFKNISEDGRYTRKKLHKYSLYVEGIPTKGEYFINDEGQTIHSKFKRMFIRLKK